MSQTRAPHEPGTPRVARVGGAYEVLARDRTGRLRWAGEIAEERASEIGYGDRSEENSRILEVTLGAAAQRLVADAAFWNAIALDPPPPSGVE